MPEAPRRRRSDMTPPRAGTMPRCVGETTCLYTPLKQMIPARWLFLVSCKSFAISLIWIQLVTASQRPAADESLIQEAIDNVVRESRFSDVYRKARHLPKELKYILLWTERDFEPLYTFGEGQRVFLENNCSVINCYVTSDRTFFGGNTTKFDAVVFNGKTLTDTDLPKHRAMDQKFIFFFMESAENNPVCSKQFDSFFNWTFTYRLDSDIPCFSIMVSNSNGEVVGPKKNMNWPSDFPEISEEYAEKLANKSKAAAWFVSNCFARSGRNILTERLQRSLAVYKHTIDVYGECGPLNCPRSENNVCNTLLERDYFFYLSFENAFSEDYVTEKLLTALQHDIVPIIFGGADYSRFLPPNSYIDARVHSVYDLAAIIDRSMNSPKLYQEFFRWKGHLTYSDRWVKNVCDVCAALNDQGRVEKVTVYEEFRKWWLPNFHERC